MTRNLGELLDRTARSFALSVRLLPPALREPVGLAYLLARAADTIADREWVPAVDRERALACIQHGSAPGPIGGTLPDGDDTARAERRLLDAVPEVIRLIGRLDEADREDVRTVVGTLVATMRSELDHFGPAAGPRPIAFPDAAALEAYTYGIAGCVGVFWTRLVARHVFGSRGRPTPADLEARGARFGCGLQLVNVLRDLPRDLRRGRCYLPEVELLAVGLAPGDLLDPAAVSALAPVLTRWEDHAEAGLREGIRYSTDLPRFPPGVRLATELPARIGLRTLAMLRNEARRLEPGVVIKVPRSAVRGAIAAAVARTLVPIR